METDPEHPLVNDLDVWLLARSNHIPGARRLFRAWSRPSVLCGHPVGQPRFNTAKSTQNPTSHDRRTEQRCAASSGPVSRLACLVWSSKQPDLCLQPAGGNTEQVVSRTPRTPPLARSRKTCTTVQKTLQCVREANRHRTKIILPKYVLLLSLKTFQTWFSFESRKPRATRQVVLVQHNYARETCRQKGKDNAVQAENL